MKTEGEAYKGAVILQDLMNTTGWRIRVWENLGWHYQISKGTISIYEAYKHIDDPTSYHAMIAGEPGQNGHGLAAWSGDFFASSDPNEVVWRAIGEAVTYVNEITQAMEEAQKAMEIGT